MIGSPRVHARRIDSTNRYARELAEAGAPHGTVVTAGEQTAGRGRQGRSWDAPAASALLMSLLVREHGGTPLPLAAAVAVCEACEALAPVTAAIKWPNDVWLDRRKVAGILVEGRPGAGWAVIGIGLNVAMSSADFTPELRDRATSLALAAPYAATVDDALASTLAALDRRLADRPERVLAAWRARDALRGARVGWAGGEGRAAGIDGEGRLLVEAGGELTALDAGEVHLLG